jgi:hypothetical protein
MEINMPVQVRNSFDKITQNKIVKGALIALSGGAAISLLTFLQGQEFGDATVNGLVAWLVPTLLNAVREWQKGA